MAGMRIVLGIFAIALSFTPSVSSACDTPSPAFQLPNFEHHDPLLEYTSTKIYGAIKSLSQRDEYNKTSFSVEVTSQTHSLCQIHHTAKIRSSVRHGAKEISNATNYRIASMTKPFTVLALLQLHKIGKLDLDAPVLEYIGDLGEPQSGSLPWKDITIRALASQMAGIPRDLAQDDLVTYPDLASQLGLPHLSSAHGPQCDSLVNYTRACNATDLLSYAKTLEPVFAPNQKSSYSNINYDLLGLVIANVSGTNYEDYVTTHVLHEIGMNGTSFSTPPDSVAAISADIEYYWPFEMGVQNPTGGLYSSSSDMSRFLRYVLSTYNAQAPGVNWFNPTSFSGSVNSFYGMPWEIFRKQTNKVVPELETTRPLTFITKGGGLPGYTSNIIVIPEYGLGITILVAGNGKAMSEMREILVREFVTFAEKAAAAELKENYVGTYKAANSSITLEHSMRDGLFVGAWTTNGVDTIKGIAKVYGHEGAEYVLHVVPTLLFVDEEKQEGERWRILPQAVGGGKGAHKVWDNFCVADWDFFMFDGKPINEIVFWEGKGGVVDRVVLTGFSVDLSRENVQGADGENETWWDPSADQVPIGRN